MTPTVGKIVIYALPIGSTLSNNGAKEAPAVVCRVFEPGTPHQKLNLRVLLDGEGTLWETSVVEGDGPGTWRWPARA